MCFVGQERSVIEDCLQKLASLMVTFRTYSGKHIDINRGDFDINFFVGLNDSCSDIHYKLLNLLDGAIQKNEKSIKGSGDEDIIVAKEAEILTAEP
jgi:hypothetical protein